MRTRKTVDCWRFYLNYGHGNGWEHEATEFTRTEMQENRRAYNEAGPWPLKITKGREKIADLPPGAYDQIQAKLQAEREARAAQRKAKWAAKQATVTE
jgi:regulator of protease activity HflC (stomatin/prohibitin superfamily)